MTSKPSAYLAGPEVFLPDPMAAGRAKREICARHGLEGIFPLDSALDLSGLEPQAAGLAIYRANRQIMERCDLILANLTPFRGPSADVGTVFEVGFMRGLGRPVFAYSNVADIFSARTRAWIGDASASRDAQGMEVEDFGLIDNLMIDGACADFENGIVTQATPLDRRFTDLAAFERCVVAAAAYLAERPA